MDAISQTTFSSAFSWMKMLEFRLKFHWSLFLRVQLNHFSIGSDNGLSPSRRQAIIWTNYDYFTDAYMRHSASMSYSVYIRVCGVQIGPIFSTVFSAIWCQTPKGICTCYCVQRPCSIQESACGREERSVCNMRAQNVYTRGGLLVNACVRNTENTSQGIDKYSCC